MDPPDTSDVVAACAGDRPRYTTTGDRMTEQQTAPDATTVPGTAAATQHVMRDPRTQYAQP